MHIESLKHLFWDCSYAQTFWNTLSNFLNHSNIHIRINFETISFGLQCNNNIETHNFILFHAKYFIFINKCKKTIPMCEQFKTYLKSKIETEKQIALINDKLPTYEQKWRTFANIL